MHNIGGIDVEVVGDVITPPDKQDMSESKGGSGFEKAGYSPRLEKVLYLLKRNGIGESDINTRIGKVDDGMVRRTSYVTIYVKSLNKIVCVCNENGNKTFLFHKDQKMELADYDALTKSEKEGGLEDGTLQGMSLNYQDRWLLIIEEFLFEDKVVEKEEGGAVDKPSGKGSEHGDKPMAEQEGEWKGFYKIESGVHIAAANTIAMRLGVSHVDSLGLIWEKYKQWSHKIRDEKGRIIKIAYCYEDIAKDSKVQEKLAEYQEAQKKSQVDTKGDWKGFYEIQLGVHIAAPRTIAIRLGILGLSSFGSICKKYKQWDHEILDVKRRIINTAYCYEDLVKDTEVIEYQESQKKPQVDAEGCWKGFYEIESGVHVAGPHAVAIRLGFPDSNYLVSILDKYRQWNRKIRSNRGRIVEVAYCYEDIVGDSVAQERLVKYREAQKKPQVDTEGPWKGFCKIESGVHVAASKTIAQRLGIRRSRSFGSIWENHEQFNDKIRDVKGRMIKTAYCYESLAKDPDVQKIIAKYRKNQK